VSVAEVHQHLRELVPHWRVEEAHGIRYLEGGYSNTNFAFAYDGERYVLRIPERAQPYVDRVYEDVWYRDLPDSFVKPVVYDRSTGRMISRWVNGRLLADIPTEELSLEALAAYLRTLHGELPACARDYDLPALLHAYGSSVPAGLALERTHACHNDLNPWNVIVTDRGWVTLDWEFAGNNDPLFDLVALHQGLALPREQLDDLAHLYLGTAAPERLERALRAFWLRELAWAEFQVREGNQRQGVIEQVAQAQDVLRSI
jgi:thiamine kinase-like enzyme